MPNSTNLPLIILSENTTHLFHVSNAHPTPLHIADILDSPQEIIFHFFSLTSDTASGQSNSQLSNPSTNPNYSNKSVSNFLDINEMSCSILPSTSLIKVI